MNKIKKLQQYFMAVEKYCCYFLMKNQEKLIKIGKCFIIKKNFQKLAKI